MKYSPKIYMKGIAILQEILLAISLFILAFLPLALLYYTDIVYRYSSQLYFISLLSVTFVMSIRPLADIYSNIIWLRPLVILRKGFGVFSASIIVSFMLYKIIISGNQYFTDYLNADFWSMSDYALMAHLGDIAAVILLVTSNVFSKRVLGKNWKRIQKLAYVYFYAGAIYEVLAFQSIFAIVCISLVTGLVFEAFIRNKANANIQP